MGKLGENIKKFRKIKNMSREYLSTKLGISVHTLSKYEQGQREPNIDMLNKISNVLGVTINELAGEQDTITKTILGDLISSGISLAEISKDTDIDLNTLEDMLNNSVNIPWENIKKLGKYIKCTDEQITQWITADTFSAVTYNNKENEPQANLIKKYFFNEPITKDEFLSGVAGEDEDFLEMIYPKIMKEKHNIKNDEDLNPGLVVNDYARPDKVTGQYLLNRQAFYDLLRLRIMDIATHYTIEVNNDDVESIVKEVNNVIEYQLFKRSNKTPDFYDNFEGIVT